MLVSACRWIRFKEQGYQNLKTQFRGIKFGKSLPNAYTSHIADYNRDVDTRNNNNSSWYVSSFGGDRMQRVPAPKALRREGGSAQSDGNILWLVTTVLAVILVCLPPVEFGLLYFVFHEVPLFVTWSLLGCRRSVISSLVTIVAAYLSWGANSPVDWGATVLISPVVLLTMELMRRLLDTKGVAWLAISAWLFAGSPLVFCFLLIMTDGNWAASFTSISYLLISGASSGVFATLLVSLLQTDKWQSNDWIDLPVNNEPLGLPQILESILVVVAYLPLVLLVYYTSKSYLDQTYDQINAIAESRFELVVSGVAMEQLDIGRVELASESLFPGWLEEKGRIVHEAESYVHWVPESLDEFKDRRYKKLSEYATGVVSVAFPLKDPSDTTDEAVLAAQVFYFEAPFWDYFQSRYQYLAGWYVGIVLVLWISALMIRIILKRFLVPLREISENVRAFRVGDEVMPDFFPAEGSRINASEVVDISSGVRRLQCRVNEDLAEMEAMNKRVLAASDAKSKFLASMSHDMRTPLTTIIGFSDLLNSDAGSAEERKQWSESISKSSQYMKEMVGNVLDMATFESGQLENNPSDVTVHSWVRDTVDLLQFRAEQAGLSLTHEIEDAVSETLEFDAPKLRDVLVNLIGNAIKYTPQGSVSLEISQLTEPGNHTYLRASITDTGIGIAPENLDKIFEPFTRLENPEGAEMVEGAGLGLAVVRSLMEAINGDIQIDSKFGLGTTVTITVPVASKDHIAQATLVTPSDQVDEKNEPLSGLIILVCEDSDTVMALLKFVLERDGARVDCAENGQIGYELFVQASQLGAPYDIVITDMQMPIMTGYELATAIRSKSDTPVLALTAFAQEEDEAKCLNAGCSGYLAKPIDIASFTGIVASFVRKNRAV